MAGYIVGGLLMVIIIVSGLVIVLYNMMKNERAYNPKYESIRRVTVLIMWLAILLSFMWEDTSVQIYVEKSDISAIKGIMEAKPSKFYTYNPNDYVHDLTDEDRTAIKGMDLIKFAEMLAQKYKFNFIDVQGKEWESILSLVEGKTTGNSYAKDFKKRTDSFGKTYFKASELPFSIIQGKLTANNNYLKFIGGQPAFIKVGILNPESSSLSFYGGLHYVTYPFSRYTLYILGISFLLYIFIPWPRVRSNIVYLARWRLILHDFVAYLIFFTFFSLPILVSGGIKRLISQNEYIILAVFFYVVFLQFGIRLMVWSVRHAMFYIEMFEDRFVINQMNEKEEFLLEEIDYIREAVLTSPKWFGRLFFLFTIFLKPRYFGSAVLATTNQNEGIIIHSRDGRAYALWARDTLGSGMYRNSDTFEQLLKKTNARRISKPYVIRAFTPPARLPAGIDYEV